MRKGVMPKIICGLVLSVMLTACGSVSSKNADFSGSSNGASSLESFDSGEIYVQQEAAGEVSAENENTSLNTEDVRAGRKLIRTANLSVETMEFDKLLDYVETKTAEAGGYIESMDVYNGSNYSNYDYYYGESGYRNDRSASLTLRIPSDKMDGFLTLVAENSNITSRSEKEQDVTLDYVDIDSHKKVLLAEQERLLALMEQAQTMEDIITLESRLSDIRYQIESMESTLRTYDNQISYSTIYLDVSEVVELTPVKPEEKTVWDRIGEGFMESLANIGNGFKEFFVWFVIAIPYLVLLALFIFILVVIILVSLKKGTERQQKKLAAMQAAQRQQQFAVQPDGQNPQQK